MAPTANTGINQNFNTFTVDMVFTWIFTPGSELSLVWKNSITDFNNEVAPTLPKDIRYTMALPPNNSYSLKLIWFVDYHAVNHALRRRVMNSREP